MCTAGRPDGAQTFGAGFSPRKTAAWRRANSSKLVARQPKIVGMTGETWDSFPLRRSAKSSSRPSARNGGTPAASRARFASSGLTLTYWTCRPRGSGELLGDLRHAEGFRTGEGVGFPLVPDTGENDGSDFGNVADVDRGNLRIVHRQEQHSLGDKRWNLSKIRVHELAGAQVGERHSRLFQPPFDLAVHAREAKRGLPVGNDAGKLDDVPDARLPGSIDEARLHVEHCRI